jgi:hypothetical protein
MLLNAYEDAKPGLPRADSSCSVVLIGLPASKLRHELCLTNFDIGSLPKGCGGD